MKYIALSFDDGRSDTYEIAKPILQKYNFKATVNVISNYVLHPEKYHFESSSKGMTTEQVIEWQRWGGR